MPHALLVEDDENSLYPLAEVVERYGFSTSCAKSLREARSELRRGPTDLVMLDLTLPDGNGMELLGDLARPPHPRVIVMTGRPTVDSAVDAVRTQVMDYIPKPLDLGRLKGHLTALADRFRAEADARGEHTAERFGLMLGSSEPMRRLYHLVDRVAPAEATVLIVGESGTGKELVAETIHQRSRRAAKPMVALNCGAVPENLIESELFGHEKGAFTGAERRRSGVFERAAGGTLLLDEITEMPLDLQVKLLRVLETRRFVAVGGEREQRADLRVIAATNRDPERAVDEGALRGDLYYRLSVFPIDVPPLRERDRDIDLLANYFLATLNRESGASKCFSPDALEHLRRYPWPGNVRQLKNVVERAFIMAEGEIDLSVLPAPGVLPIREAGPAASPAAAPVSVVGAVNAGGGREDAGGGDAGGGGGGAGAAVSPGAGHVRVSVGSSIAETERELIFATLRHYHGDKARTADALGVSLTTLYSRLNSYRS